jgi:DNA-binding response OmpR family regulator
LADRAHLLVVDDEAGIREMLAEYFALHDFEVRSAPDAASARLVVSEFRPQLVFLDLNMPGENGLSFARWLRENVPGCGIVMLTAMADTVDRVVGLELGADDYVAKPCDLRELLARARSVLRRIVQTATTEAADAATAVTAATVAAGKRVTMGRCVLDLDIRRLFAEDGSDVPITSMEYDLLAAFAANPDRPMDRDKLLSLAHRREWEPFDRSIDIRIARLRRKIERDPAKPEALRTVRGVGYVFTQGKP